MEPNLLKMLLIPPLKTGYFPGMSQLGHPKKEPLPSLLASEVTEVIHEGRNIQDGATHDAQAGASLESTEIFLLFPGKDEKNGQLLSDPATVTASHDVSHRKSTA